MEASTQGQASTIVGNSTVLLSATLPSTRWARGGKVHNVTLTAGCKLLDSCQLYATGTMSMGLSEGNFKGVNGAYVHKVMVDDEMPLGAICWFFIDEKHMNAGVWVFVLGYRPTPGC